MTHPLHSKALILRVGYSLLGVAGWINSAGAQQTAAIPKADSSLVSSTEGGSTAQSQGAASQPATQPATQSAATSPSTQPVSAKLPPVDSYAAVNKAMQEMGLDPTRMEEVNGGFNAPRQATKLTIEGTIETADGAPLPADTRVMVASGERPYDSSQVTVKDGKFHDTVYPQCVILSISATGYAPVLVGPVDYFEDPSPKPLKITLDKGVSMQVKITDSDNRPMAHAFVKSMVRSGYLTSREVNTPADENGIAHLEHLASTGMTLTIGAPECYTLDKTLVPTPAQVLEVSLARRPAITGIVTQASDGKPIANARVYIHDGGSDPREAKFLDPNTKPNAITDAQGKFSAYRDFYVPTLLTVLTPDKRVLSVGVQDGQAVAMPMPEPLYVRGWIQGDLSQLQLDEQGNPVFQWQNPWQQYGLFYAGQLEQQANLPAKATAVGDHLEFELFPVFPGPVTILAGPTPTRLEVTRAIDDQRITLPPRNANPATQPVNPTSQPAPEPQGLLRLLPMNGWLPVSVALSGAAIQPQPAARPGRNANPAIPADAPQPADAQPDPAAVQPIPVPKPAPNPANPAPVVSRQVIVRLIPPPGTENISGFVHIRDFDGTEKWVQVANNAVRFNATVDGRLWVDLSTLNLPQSYDNLIEVTAGKGPLIHDIDLPPAGAVRCRVVDEAGHPLRMPPTARVVSGRLEDRYFDIKMGLASHHETGVYLLTGLPQGRPIVVEAGMDMQGYGSTTDVDAPDSLRIAASTPITLTPQEPVKEITLVVPTGRDYKIHVINPEGKPMPGHRVTLVWARSKDDFRSKIVVGLTDGHGDLLLKGIDPPTGTGWKVIADEAPGLQKEVATLDPAQSEMTLQLRQGLGVRGVLTDADSGRPIINATVQAQTPYNEEFRYLSTSVTAYTNARGEFEFTSLSPGDYYFTVPYTDSRPRRKFFGMRLGSGLVTAKAGQEQPVFLEVGAPDNERMKFLLGDAVAVTPPGNPAASPATHPGGGLTTQPTASASQPATD